MKKRIAVMKGDGIGPEIVDEAIKVLNRIAERFHHTFFYDEMLTGCAALDVYGTALRDEDYETACAADALLFGAIGDSSKWTYTGANGTKIFKSRAESDGKAIQVFRRKNQLYCNIRPTKIYPGLIEASPLKNDLAKGVDLIVLRENTAGTYFSDKVREERNGEQYASDNCEYYWHEVERLAEAAFKLAMGRKKKVTMVAKWNVMDTGILWQEAFDAVSKKYPSVTYEQMLSDNCAMQLVKRPEQFDIIATDNLFGDILSDLASGVGGSLGMAGSASIGGVEEGVWGLYECAGGSAPKYAGKNRVNPIGEIRSASMMLRYSFGMIEEADAVETAIEKAIHDGYRTYDIMNDGCTLVTCSGMGDVISGNI